MDVDSQPLQYNHDGAVWIFGRTHEPHDHEAFWKMMPIMKPTPDQMSEMLKVLRKERSCQDTSGSIYEAWQCVPNLKKMLRVRNEHGLFSQGHSAMNPSKTGLYIADDLSVMTAEGQQSSIAEHFGTHNVGNLGTNFILIGCSIDGEDAMDKTQHDEENDLDGKLLIVFFKHHLRSVSIDAIRDVCSLMKTTNYYRLMIVTPTPITKTTLVALSIEYDSIDIEVWSSKEMMFDWFSHALVNPMCVIRRRRCRHSSDASVSLCEVCIGHFEKSISDSLKKEIHAFPAIIDSCQLNRRFKLEPGDIIDSQRVRARMLRAYHEKGDVSFGANEEDL